MQFLLPQFIERDPKIVGPFTFKQFVYVGIGGISIVVLYFAVGLNIIFIITAIAIAGIALSLVFVRIGPYNLPAFIKNAILYYLGSQKLYIWQKKTVVPKIKLERKIEKKPEKEKAVELKVAKKSKLSSLSTKIETNIR